MPDVRDAKSWLGLDNWSSSSPTVLSCSIRVAETSGLARWTLWHEVGSRQVTIVLEYFRGINVDCVLRELYLELCV